MVNELRQLLRDNVSSPPPEDLDLTDVLSGGRRRVRRRRLSVAMGGTALATAAVVGLSALVGQGPNGGGVADRPPAPDAPTIRLSDAEAAVEGPDYQVLASHTNEDLEQGNGQYFDGVTDDGRILYTDGPHGLKNTVRRALMDPATGDKQWLPEAPVPRNSNVWPVELGADRLVFAGVRYGKVKVRDTDGAVEGGRWSGSAFALVFDRQAGGWHYVDWSTLPTLDGADPGTLSPDGRLYLKVPATQGQPPEGGWPTGPDGEADDADADGDTFDLWSVSLTDPADVRDEGLRIGDLAFTDDAMVWTDGTNGEGGLVHVRDLASGEESSFDPNSGEKCNLLTFGAAGDRIVLGQYCGTYADGVRDDRVQVVTTEGEQVVTLQDSGIEGRLASPDDGGLVTVESHDPDAQGTYVYDLADQRFLRISDSISSYGVGGPTSGDNFLWHTAVNDRKGATQWLGELRGD